MASVNLRAFAPALLLFASALPDVVAEPPPSGHPKVVKALKSGIRRLEHKQYQAALSDFQRSARLAGGPCGPCLLGLARAYNGLGDRAKAAEAARNAIPLIDRADGLAQAYNELGVALAGDEAEAAFRNALDLARQVLAIEPQRIDAKVVLCQAKRVTAPPFVAPASPAIDPCEKKKKDGQLLLVTGGLVGGDSVIRPKKVFGEVPKVPPAVRRSAAYGMSVLSAIIDEEGCVRNVMVCEGGTEGFDEAAQETISRWVFEPATVKGAPVSVYYTLTTRFRVYSR
jgi:TonB family protein